MASPKTRVTFAAFKEKLAQSRTGPERMADMKALHKELGRSSPDEVLAFGKELDEAIQIHEANDNLAKAHSEGRAIFRSWHRPGAVDAVDYTDKTGNSTKTSQPRLGFDTFNVTLDRNEFRKHKDAYKAGETAIGPMIETPSSLLQPNQMQPPVFNDEHATVTALLPEEHYAAFFAFNEVAKGKARSERSSASGHVWGEVESHAKSMRSNVTRPVFFAYQDIGSYSDALPDPDPKKPPHVRKGYAIDEGEESVQKLGATFDEKMADPVRANAVFYQTFDRSVPAEKKKDTNAWNEMVVKFRATGHTAPLANDREMEKVVPAFRGRAPLEIAPVMTAARPNRSSTEAIEPIRAPAQPVATGKTKSSRKK